MGISNATKPVREDEKIPWATINQDLTSIALRIPRVRKGSYFPPWEPRRMAEKAAHGRVQEVDVQGVSIRSVDDLVQAMGIDDRVKAFRTGRSRAWPYL